MALKTTLELIEEIEATITKIQSGQEVYSGDKRIRMPELSTLYRERSRLIAQYNKEQGNGGPRMNQGIHRRDY